MKKYLFEIDLVKCDMPLSAAVIFMSGQDPEKKFSNKDIINNNNLFNENKHTLKFEKDRLIFNDMAYDFINNTLIVNHDGSVSVFPKIKGQSALNVEYLDRNRVLAHVFFDRSSEELYVFSFTRQRMYNLYTPVILGDFENKVKVVFNNFIQMLEFVSFNIQRRWAIKQSTDFNLSIQTNQYILNKDYFFLDSDREVILVKNKKSVDVTLYPSRLQSDFNFSLNEAHYEIRSDFNITPKFNPNNLNLRITESGFIEILPKKFNRILFDGYSVPLEDEHILIKVVEG